MMSHYEERLEGDLTIIRDRVSGVGKQVTEALRKATHSLETFSHEVANEVILGDLPINREIRAIDKLCHAFVAQHLPSAGHLRYVSSVLRLNVELERIGDYAVAIAREAVQLTRRPSKTFSSDIHLIADQAQQIFGQAMEAFNDENVELARGTKKLAVQVETTLEKVFDDLVAEGERGNRPVRDLFAQLIVINRYARVSDQAKNICEDTLFAVAGEIKEEKVYRILFVDETNDGLSLIAEAYARKAFEESGKFASAGWAAADRIHPATEAFLIRNGLDSPDLQPKSLNTESTTPAAFHIVVGLAPGIEDQLVEIPFHTVVTRWNVAPISAGLDQERYLASIDEAFKLVKFELQDLFKTIRGEESE